MIAFEPSADVAAVLQLAAVGAFAGTTVSLRRRRRDPESDTFGPAAWGALGGFLAGLGIVFVERLA